MDDFLTFLVAAIPAFCFGYPFVMSWYWMAGGLLFYATRERRLPPPDEPPAQATWPPISIIVPCYNEGLFAEETLRAADACDYPEFEIIAVNDGSNDLTNEVLNALAEQMPRLRVVHLTENHGKATALNAGALLARHEILVCIDGDAMLDPQALRWVALAFRQNNVGAVAGNPRIRNRTSFLGRLQVGEFSSIIGLIKRTQTMYGRLFTVSGVICAFRKLALERAGWWSPRSLTEDVDITWRIQVAGWRVVYEPNVLAWILMPETLSGLWRQRLRWAEGGAQMVIDFFRPMVRLRRPDMLPMYLNFMLSIVWSYVVLFALLLGVLIGTGVLPSASLPAMRLVPEWWGMTLALTYICQALTALLIEERYERKLARSVFWIIWYPMVFWLLTTLTAVVSLPYAILRPRRERTTWVSPDRGLR
ncbi:poly-beta-1,6-N-acetyl-D-glucosamine synthase [soil metagenome]